jgi:hypothetical protein
VLVGDAGCELGAALTFGGSGGFEFCAHKNNPAARRRATIAAIRFPERRKFAIGCFTVSRIFDAWTALTLLKGMPRVFVQLQNTLQKLSVACRLVELHGYARRNTRNNRETYVASPG